MARSAEKSGLNGNLAKMKSGMLLAMLIVWEREGHPHYASMGAKQHIAYISDIGAQGLKPLFIAGCCVTTVFLDLSFASERWLRHTGRLARNLGVAEKVLSALSSTLSTENLSGTGWRNSSEYNTYQSSQSSLPLPEPAV